MATRVSARLTARQGRRFGVTVGAAFMLLAGIMWWREHPALMIGLGSLGAALALAGLIVPTRLGPVERVWMALAHAISRVTTPIVMAVIYFVVLTPVGLLRRRVARNPMMHGQTSEGFWKVRGAGERRTGSMERQF